ncbi:Bifunctional NADP-dependent methylenetetrahydromethanopterin dehydrogenase/methylenetetrahydrofolate dehydrogenase [Planctomycetales bacterium 10988]|nr:Bifunctional NADP-dependent methylenetetrahydromethanopterin dehydrogenase/methylenetetrahydrofolate dehydrogenase [Planctomycetales bacterium 10988]
MAPAKILLQLDGDAQPSVFDSVVAVDSGVDQLFRHGSVEAEQVAGLVHGLLFTRKPDDLRYSAVFVGGSNVSQGEALFKAVKKAFFGPFAVSVLLDPNGSNTTSAAAVHLAGKHVDLENAKALVLGGTGPVGQRVARLLAGSGAEVRIGSRSLDRANVTCEAISKQVSSGNLVPISNAESSDLAAALEGVQIVVAAGAAGVQLLSEEERKQAKDLVVAIDLNAVPPLGLEGVDMQDKAKLRDGAACYGALGVGGTKMKIHRTALEKLFEQNNQIFDAEEMLDLAKKLEE